MSDNVALNENPIRRVGASDGRNGTERLVLWLIALGMIASLIAFLSLQQSVRSQAKPDELGVGNIVKSQLYYVAHATEIFLLVSAGLVSLRATNFRMIRRGYPLQFVLLLGAALLMTARGYAFSDLVSTKLVDSTGPFPFFMAVLVFVGSRRSNWTFLGKVMMIMAVLFSALALLAMVGLQTFTRSEAVAGLTGTLGALFPPASWIALQNYPTNSFARRLRFAPMVVYSLGSLFIQTRLNFVLLFAFLAVYTYVQRKRRIPQTPTWMLGLILSLWVGLFTAVFLRDSPGFERIESVATAFSSRLDEDTRTGQLISFFEDVQPHELLLGRGSFATWNWGGMPYGGGTDVGYLSLLLYGGVPLLLTCVATHVLPCFTVFRKNLTDLRLTSAAVVLLWSVAMFSSTYPAMELGHYTILLCVGACISTDFSDRDRRVRVEPMGS